MNDRRTLTAAEILDAPEQQEMDQNKGLKSFRAKVLSSVVTHADG
jgi:hypothetical protein